MDPCVKDWFAKVLCLVQRRATQGADTCPALWACVMLIYLTVAILPWQAMADTISAPQSNSSEHTRGSPRRGVVTIMSNLRTTPSIHSDIVAIAKEGTHVEILVETERWYRVRNEEGVEAWIYKPLVLIEPMPLKGPSAIPAASAQPDIEDTPAASATTPAVATESRSENTPEQQDLGASPAVLLEEQRASSKAIGIDWLSDTMLPYVQGLGAYVIIALVLVLVLSIALQLRAARQLRRAMQEMGQILDIVEEIYTDGTIARTSDRGAPLQPISTEAPSHQPQPQ